MASSILRTALMTSVYSANPTKNYEYVTRHGIGNGTLTDYIYFSRPFPPGATITSARLVFCTDKITTSTLDTISVARLRQSVAMTKVTYKTRPTALYPEPSLTVAIQGPQPAGATWTVDVTTHMQAVSDGAAWYGWQLTATGGTKNILGPRWPTTTLRPRLEVEWTLLPQAPAGLSPSAGRAVGVPSPVLRGSYTDPGADNAIAAVQVQTNPINGSLSMESSPTPTQVLVGYGNIRGPYSTADTADYNNTPGHASLINGAGVDLFGAVECHHENNMDQYLLSRLKLLNTDWELARGAGGNSYFYKPSKYALVKVTPFTMPGNRDTAVFVFRHKVTNFQVTIVHTHFRADDTDGTSRSSERAQQAAFCVNLMKTVKNGILTGDFNSYSMSAGFPRQQFAVAGLVGLQSRGAATNTGLNSYDGAAQGRWIEDILTRSSEAVSAPFGMYPTNGVSDHWGWMKATVTFTSSTAYGWDSASAPLWDSGLVPASTAELVTASQPGWVPLTDGEARWWRMRVQDVNGLISAWSVPEQFLYDVKGTLALVNPGLAPNNFVNEATPPIAWTLTGEAQSAYAVTVSKDGRAVWTSGKVTSTADGITLPPNVLTETGDTYRLVVTVWDAKSRESTPGDPAYVSISRDFTFALSTATLPVTAVTANADLTRPRVVVGWTRSTFPDSFTVLRNGAVVASGLDPAETSLTSTTHSWTDPAPLPGTAVTYSVAAVVNGKASSGNASVSATCRTVGTWLSTFDHSIEVLIVGRESERQWTHGEQSEVQEVVGGTEVLVVTHALRGLEGTITGQLLSGVLDQAPTAIQWKNAAMTLRSRAGQTMWLTAGDATIPVVIRNMTVKPRPIPTQAYDISFDFYQVAKPK